MKIIHGPSYRYQGERLLQPEIILVQDHHYHPDHGHALRDLLDASICPADQHLLIFDHVLRQDEFSDYPHVCLPLLAAAECAEFNQAGITPQWGDRSRAFNFIINKPRPNRIMLLDMIHDLGLTDYHHTLCWQQDYRTITATDYTFGDEKRHDRGISHGPHKNCENYKDHLQSRIFETTCVSLITEPVFYERETIITEKTLMTIWGGTLPIWVGGWCCAAVMRDFGFDVFDDIVDHSYENLPEPAERCQQAIYRNIGLLQKPHDLSSLVPRLDHNLELLRRNVFLDRIRQLIDQNPAIKAIAARFRSGLLQVN